MLVPYSAANPSGENVIRGSVAFERNGSTLTITQNTDRAIINWNEFSIAGGELTKFLQPSASSAALNRVINNTPSEIFGTLEATGKIYLINPSGILVGKSGVINTQGFVASTLDVTDDDFWAGSNITFKGDSKAMVKNLGNISVDGGDIFLIAKQVVNKGEISATDGTVGLASGEEILLTETPADSGRRLFVRLNNTGGPVETGVINEGVITSAQAELAAAGGNMYALAIKNSGKIRATGYQSAGGKIFLTAGENSKILQSGELSAELVVAEGPEGAKTFGGEIKIIAEEGVIEMTEGAIVNATGTDGGGTIHIGGSKRGDGPLPNAKQVTIQPNVTILADALENGNGGEIIVYANDTAQIYGTFSARGGAFSGDGGFVETSGKNFWIFPHWYSSVDVTAVNGLAGEFLIDPTRINIEQSTVAGGSVAGSPVSANTIFDFDINTFLASSNLTIESDSLVAGNGDIIVSGDVVINWTANTSLRVNAHRSIKIRSGAQIISTSGDITLISNETGVTGNFRGIDLDNTTLQTIDGNIMLIGSGGTTSNDNGVRLRNGTKIVSSNGDISITGQGGGDGLDGNGRGVLIVGNNTEVITSGSGNIFINGIGGSGNGDDNVGVLINNRAKITAGSTGNIEITGVGGIGLGSNNRGVFLGRNSVIENENGDIMLTGTSNTLNADAIFVNGRSSILVDNTDNDSGRRITIETGSGNLGEIDINGRLQARELVVTSNRNTDISSGSIVNNVIGIAASITGINQTFTFSQRESFRVTSIAGISGVQSNGDITLRSLSNTVTLVDGVMSSNGDIRIGANTFINNAGSNALQANEAWRVWSDNPVDDVVGSLTPDFIQFGRSFNRSNGVGDGLIYRDRPDGLSFGGTELSKVFDGNTDASAGLSESDFVFTFGGTQSELTPNALNNFSATYANANPNPVPEPLQEVTFDFDRIDRSKIIINGVEISAIGVRNRGVFSGFSQNIGRINPVLPPQVAGDEIAVPPIIDFDNDLEPLQDQSFANLTIQQLENVSTQAGGTNNFLFQPIVAEGPETLGEEEEYLIYVSSADVQ
ncbi:MAG: filamentous hemagglutinin N-terminal domain-containing protein [Verrucomicrobiota bacterium]